MESALPRVEATAVKGQNSQIPACAVARFFSIPCFINICRSMRPTARSNVANTILPLGEKNMLGMHIHAISGVYLYVARSKGDPPDQTCFAASENTL